ncbi:MAG: tetratricopeptide repeat protein [bacterium]
MMPRSRNSLFIGLTLAVLVIAGFVFLPYLRPAPEIVQPENFERIDPAVQALIKSKVTAAEVNPRNAGVHGDLGLVYEANLLWEEARLCFENAADLAPEELSWQYHLAISHRQIGDYKQAIEIMQALAGKHPAVPYLQQRIGEALLETGELEGAEAAFRKLIDLAPEAAQGYTGLGDVMLQKEEYPLAAQLLEKAITLDTNYRHAHYLLGTAYHRLEQVEKANEHLSKGKAARVRFLPDPQSRKLGQYAVNVTARLQQAEALLAVGQPKQAAQILELALPYHQDNVTLLNTLAVAYMRIGLLDEAGQSLRKAEKHDESKFMTYINLSSLALRQNQAAKALQFADSAAARAAKLDQAFFTRAQALDRLERYDEALASLQTAQQNDPHNPQNFAFAGDIRMKLDNAANARTLYLKAIELDGNMLPALVGLARANWKLHRRDEAKTALNNAKRIAPGHPIIRKLEQQFSATK